MDITFSNKNTIKISGKGADVAINASAGTKADLLLFTGSSAKAVPEKSFYGPGEYEVMGIMVDGVEISASNTAYSLVVDDMHVTYAIGLETTLTDAQLERMDGVDILIISVQDNKADLMNKIISQVEPKVLIPIMAAELELAKIKAEFGKDTEPIDKYKVSKKDLPLDNQQLVILK
ncbi:hypothetical protein EXS66_00360 [Candidatus Saccharibacteria bacterium]|nr:hypothetical protein [Candidatus Saccharibacteria bacterium]